VRGLANSARFETFPSREAIRPLADHLPHRHIKAVSAAHLAIIVTEWPPVQIPAQVLHGELWSIVLAMGTPSATDSLGKQHPSIRK